jgi:Ca-activated chloride channel family protein
MTQNSLSPDDPRLTAYAFNEMAAAERAEFERLLQQDAAARQAVEEIRAAGALFTTALEHEPTPVAASDAKAAIVPGGDLRKLDGGGQPFAELKQQARILRFPQFYYLVSGMAAACFALFFVYWQRNQPVVEQTSYMEVDLVEAKEKAAKQQAAYDAAVEAKVREAQERVAMRSAAAPAPASAPAVTFELPEATMPAPAPMVSADSLAQVGRLDEHEQVLKLSPFEVSGDAASSPGYTAATTIAGNRMNTELRDVGSAVTVANQQFLKDVDDSRYTGRVAARKMASRNPPAPPPPVDQWGSTRVSLDFNTEAYGFRKDNDYLRVRDNPLSTFSVDVDTAAYANVRRFLTQGQRPPADAVRIEELVNYFPYHYAPPTGAVPFAAHLEVASAPWAPEHRLVRIGLKGREVSDAARPMANLVFLLDVSGSMQSPNKLPLVKQSLRLLVDKLRADDRVAIAVYAGSSGLALPSTPASRKADILEAIDRLEAGGSTNGAMGIHLAYDIAKANFVAGGVNRVILATDGDFNVGVTNEGELVRLIEEKAKGGVFLSVLGYGMGNLKDATLEQLADKGNGNYAYIDSLAEAKKTLVEQAGGTLVTIAKDVKIQVEFNPAQVAAYRLIGYENRLLKKEDFNNDKVDAGEIGSGHTVTALYEIVPAGAELPEETPAVDQLKYQRVATNGATAAPPSKARGEVAAAPGMAGELLTVKVRYKEPAGDVSSKQEFPLRDSGARFEDASQDFKFAAAVAGFGMALRDSPHRGSLTLADISAWGRAGLGSDAGGYRSEFLGLVEKAQPLLQ